MTRMFIICCSTLSKEFLLAIFLGSLLFPNKREGLAILLLSFAWNTRVCKATHDILEQFQRSLLFNLRIKIDCIGVLPIMEYYWVRLLMIIKKSSFPSARALSWEYSRHWAYEIFYNSRLCSLHVFLAESQLLCLLILITITWLHPEERWHHRSHTTGLVLSQETWSVEIL